MSASPQTIRVRLAERSYDIEIGTGTLDAAGEFVSARRRLSHAVIVADPHVEEPHARLVAGGLGAAGAEVDLLVVEPGEQAKSLDNAAALWHKLLDLGADRRTVLFAVGGGVVGDLAGWVAACYARGIALVQVPTTLLAQVDSSVGGKVGVNLPGAKNMVGAFWQPLLVVIDTATLATLPEREYRSGLAEVVKYGAILDAGFFAWLEGNAQALRERHDDALRHTVARCCRLKADVVEGDEREESGLRAVLNYGHTFAHAFETLTGYGQLLHGEAVAMGMHCAARLALRLGRVDAAFVERQHDLLTAFGLPTAAPDGIDRHTVLAAMAHDKKVEHGRLRFVLPDSIGHVELVSDVPADDVLAALE